MVCGSPQLDPSSTLRVIHSLGDPPQRNPVPLGGMTRHNETPLPRRNPLATLSQRVLACEFWPLELRNFTADHVNPPLLFTLASFPPLTSALALWARARLVAGTRAVRTTASKLLICKGDLTAKLFYFGRFGKTQAFSRARQHPETKCERPSLPR
jgi:hypothetical protein